MTRFLIRRTALGPAGALADHPRGVRAVLRRTQQRGPDAGRAAGHTGHDRADQPPLGLDQSLWKQYLNFIGHALRGDLGYDYYHQVPVTTIIGQALPITLSLAVGASIIWLVLGVFNGVVSATHPRSLADRGLTFFALFFYSMPSFLLGLLLLYFLYFRLTLTGRSWFPPAGTPRSHKGSAPGCST